MSTLFTKTQSRSRDIDYGQYFKKNYSTDGSIIFTPRNPNQINQNLRITATFNNYNYIYNYNNIVIYDRQGINTYNLTFHNEENYLITNDKMFILLGDDIYQSYNIYNKLHYISSDGQRIIIDKRIYNYYKDDGNTHKYHCCQIDNTFQELSIVTSNINLNQDLNDTYGTIIYQTRTPTYSRIVSDPEYLPSHEVVYSPQPHVSSPQPQPRVVSSPGAKSIFAHNQIARRAEEEAAAKKKAEAEEARKAEEAAARRTAEEAAARRTAEEAAAKKKAEEEAAAAAEKAEKAARRKAEEEAAAARRKAEEAARRTAAEEAARRTAAEAKKKAEEEAARRKAEEEAAAARRKAEEEAAARKEAEEAARKEAEEAARKEAAEALKKATSAAKKEKEEALKKAAAKAKERARAKAEKALNQAKEIAEADKVAVTAENEALKTKLQETQSILYNFEQTMTNLETTLSTSYNKLEQKHNKIEQHVSTQKINEAIKYIRENSIIIKGLKNKSDVVYTSYLYPNDEEKIMKKDFKITQNTEKQIKIDEKIDKSKFNDLTYIKLLLEQINNSEFSKYRKKYIEYLYEKYDDDKEKIELELQKFQEFLIKFEFYLKCKSFFLQDKKKELIEFIKKNSTTSNQHITTPLQLSQLQEEAKNGIITNSSKSNDYIDTFDEFERKCMDDTRVKTNDDEEEDVYSLEPDNYNFFNKIQFDKYRSTYINVFMSRSFHSYRLMSGLKKILLYVYLYLSFTLKTSLEQKNLNQQEDILRDYKNREDYSNFIKVYLLEDIEQLKILKITFSNDSTTNYHNIKKIIDLFFNSKNMKEIKDNILNKIVQFKTILLSYLINKDKNNKKEENKKVYLYHFIVFIKKSKNDLNFLTIINQFIKRYINDLNSSIKDELQNILDCFDLDKLDDEDKKLGGYNDDFINLRNQIIDFYNNDIILRYIYNYDQIILFNYLNYLISKNEKFKILLDNKNLLKLINKDLLNNLISKLKIDLDLNEVIEDKKEELFSLKPFFRSNDIILNGFDNFINYLFVFLLSVKSDNSEFNQININDNIYDLNDISTLNIYNLPQKSITIMMSSDEEEIARHLLDKNNKEVLINSIYHKFSYLKKEKKEFNNNNLYIINDSILNYLNKLKINNDDNNKILNTLKEIEMKLNRIHIYSGGSGEGGDDANKKDLTTKVKDIINNTANTITTAATTAFNDKFQPRKSNPVFNSTINRLVEKYDNSEYPNELKKFDFYNSVKNNNLDPAVELEISNVDKYIFIVVAYFIRLLTLLICHYYIDANAITDIKFSIYYYLTVYIFIFVVLVIIINFDTFKLRILVNYMNLHINTSGIFTHLMLMCLFIYLIYLLINNIIGYEQPPTQLTENQKIKLKYKLDVLTLIIYAFIFIFVLVF